MKLIQIVALVLFTTIAFARKDHTNTLMSAFGGECSSSGSMTSTAMNHSEAIKGIIKSIQNDKSCREWAQGIGSLVEMSSSLQVSTGRYEKLLGEISDLEKAITLTTEPNELYVLGTALAEKKVELYNLEQGSSDRAWEERTNALNGFNQYVTALNATVEGNSKCANRYPGLIMQLGGQILQMSGSFNIWGTIIGAALMAVGTITDMVVDAVRTNRFGRTLRKLEDSTLTESLICSFETISATYCEARETRERIALADQANISIYDKKWRGLLLMKTLPHYTGWITRVVAGTPASNGAIAERKKGAIKLRSKLNQTKEDVNSIIEEGRLLLANTSENEKKKNVVKQIIKGLGFTVSPKYSTMSGNGHSNPRSSPFNGIFVTHPADGPFTYFYTGHKEPALNPNESWTNYVLRINGNMDPPAMEIIVLRIDQLMVEAQEYVDIQFLLVKETDPESVLADAERPEKRQRLPSPIKFLVLYEKYMKHMIDSYAAQTPASVGYVISQTKDLAHNAIIEYRKTVERSVNDVRNKKEGEITAKSKLNNIQKSLAPEMKTSFLGDRLKKIVNFELNLLLKNGDIPQLIKELMLLSITDGIGTLDAYVGVNMTAIKSDARGAMKSSFENLEALSKVFTFKIWRILRSLKKKIKKYPGVEEFQETRGKLCATLLAIPNQRRLNTWTRFRKYCKGAKLVSAYSRSKIKLEFNKLYKKGFKDRVCAHHEYLVQNELYHLFGKIAK